MIVQLNVQHVMDLDQINVIHVQMVIIYLVKIALSVIIIVKLVLVQNQINANHVHQKSN